MITLAKINPENATEAEVKEYRVREAARAVVFDDAGDVAMLHVRNEKYYKLPGGGIESGEDTIAALKRECLEEIGCEIEVIDELGSIVEFRKMWRLQQISYCYVAKVTGKKGNPQSTQEEINDGFEQLWLPYPEALSLISNNKATNLEGSAYIVPRDSIFLKRAEGYVL